MFARRWKSFWDNIDNNNRTCERLIGCMTKLFIREAIKDLTSLDETTVVEEKYRGYVYNASRVF